VSNRQRSSSPGTTRCSETRIGAVSGNCTRKGYGALCGHVSGSGGRRAAGRG
jgi:hypothetical protein